MTGPVSLMRSGPVVVTSEEIEEGLYQTFRRWGIPEWRARAIARQEHPGIADRINERSARDGCRVYAE